MSSFIGYTVGLTVSHENYRTGKLMKVEFSRDGDLVTLKAVSGHNLEPMRAIKSIKIQRDEFADRPHDPYNNIVEARWAFEKLGIEL
jgi:hypothetical protein